MKSIQLEQIRVSLLHSWSLQTSSKWTPANPAKGQCSVTALVIHDLLGGQIVKTAAPEGSHFYNIVDGVRLDFTASQFAETLLYEDIPSSRKEAFTDTNASQYEELRRHTLRYLKSFTSTHSYNLE
ncbi:hypothetical protein CHH91_04100 [Virgibacillus sp. 7505]|uniref:YunG family protein n=1 Tax=Virgibacillus sp. 7505 TaxID=2022548 RepID=UPI000BA543DE|nr:hypothetical protein [Virgibacillus sp. 7505]PAE17402.1 hypothetical protein CHH91_04100 [Virgibacillus sp. 7505]